LHLYKSCRVLPAEHSLIITLKPPYIHLVHAQDTVKPIFWPFSTVAMPARIINQSYGTLPRTPRRTGLHITTLNDEA